jgi:hypothetical protein
MHSLVHVSLLRISHLPQYHQKTRNLMLIDYILESASGDILLLCVDYTYNPTQDSDAMIDYMRRIRSICHYAIGFTPTGYILNVSDDSV